MNSGSSANLIAFMTLTSPLLGERRVKRGDEVITVACGFPTTVNPMIQYGAVPVFVDVTIPQYNIDVTKGVFVYAVEKGGAYARSRLESWYKSALMRSPSRLYPRFYLPRPFPST